MGRDLQIFKSELKLNELYDNCINELKSVGLDIYQIPNVGSIDICLSKRNNKRYGCCKQEEPVKDSKVVERKGRKWFIRYELFNKHHIEISPWVMQLDDDIIKNTIMHELIHCLPHCNNHGQMFKKYAVFINEHLGYNISRVGNKKEDFLKSDVDFSEDEHYNYHITCKNCGQSFFRKRMNRNFTRKFRCAKCNGMFEVESIN